MAELMMFQPGTAFMNSYNQAKAGSLAKIAFTEPQRRQSALADLYGLDPQAANSMKKEFDTQEQEQLKTFATAFMNTPDDLKPQMYGRAKEMWRPRFQALGSDIPDDWKQALPTIQALAGVGQQQPPAKVQEAQWFAKQIGLDPAKDPQGYAEFMRQAAGYDNSTGLKINGPTGTLYQNADGGMWIRDWGTRKWEFVPGPGQAETPPPPTGQQPPPQTGGKQPPPQMAGADPKATFQTLANRYGAQITSVNRTPEQNARVGGVANSFHLTGQAGDFVVPQQNKAQFMAEAKAMGYEAIDEGDHIHLEPRGRPMAAPAVGGAPSAPPPSPNNPFAKKGYQMATAEQKAAFGIPPDVPAQIGPDGQVNVINLPNKDAPAGYRYAANGALEFIPGGPADPANKTNAKDSTADEKSAKGYLDRMIAAEKELDGLINSGFKPNVRDFYTAGQGAAINWAASPDGQVWRQQQEDWVRAKLRRESGAAIPPEEMDREIKTYFPQPGDSKQVIESKRRSRIMAQQQLKTMAGRANASSAQPPAGNQPASGKRVGRFVIEEN